MREKPYPSIEAALHGLCLFARTQVGLFNLPVVFSFDDKEGQCFSIDTKTVDGGAIDIDCEASKWVNRVIVRGGISHIIFYFENDGPTELEPETPFEKEKEARRQRRAKAEESDE